MISNVCPMLLWVLILSCHYRSEAFQQHLVNFDRVASRVSVESRHKHVRHYGNRHLTLSAKKSTGSAESFFCESCGTEFIKWMGRCPACKEWNAIKTFRPVRDSVANIALDPRTLAQLPVSKKASKSSQPASPTGGWASSDSASSLIPMTSIMAPQGVDPQSKHYRDPERIQLFSSELNRVLGGGLVKGSVTLITGEPGVGKSTLLLQLAASMARHGPVGGTGATDVTASLVEVTGVKPKAEDKQEEAESSVVYISGEENARQIAMRAKRLQLPPDDLFLICDNDIDAALISITQAPSLPSLIIVDSVQTMKTSYATSPSAAGSSGPGSTSQVRDVTARLVQFAKSTGIPIVIVGHVTKTGDVAGPRILEHMVDTVLYIEGSANSNDDYRLIRSEKNRFGSAAEVGVFCMTEKGMEDVSNPSALFLTSSVMQEAQEGAAVVIVMEGTRPLLAEIQCLVSNAYSAPNGAKVNPKRAADGFPIQRLLLLCAVIEKRLNIPLYFRDVYLNIVGGLRIAEPSADLAVSMAIISSVKDDPIIAGTAFIGEVGLRGELRGGKRIEQRISEAVKAGCRRVIIPKTYSSSSKSKQLSYEQHEGVDVIPCDNLSTAMKHGLTRGGKSAERGKFQKGRRDYGQAAQNTDTINNDEQSPYDLEDEEVQEHNSGYM